MSYFVSKGGAINAISYFVFKGGAINAIDAINAILLISYFAREVLLLLFMLLIFVLCV